MKPKRKSSTALLVSFVLHLIIGVVGFFFWPSRNQAILDAQAIEGALMQVEKPKIKRLSRPRRPQVRKEVKSTTQSNSPRLKILTSNAPATERGVMSAAEATPFNALDSLNLSDGIGPATDGITTPTAMPQVERVITGPVAVSEAPPRPKSRLVKFIERQQGPQRIIYCVDLSSSMLNLSQLKLKRILDIMKDSLDFLEPHDSFNVVAFSEEVEFFRPGFLSVNGLDVSDTAAYLGSAKPTKNTRYSDKDMLEALNATQEQKPTIVVLFSDGILTSGMPDLQKIRQRAAGGVRIFTMGIGMAEDFPGAVLLRMLADGSQGEFWLVETEG